MPSNNGGSPLSRCSPESQMGVTDWFVPLVGLMEMATVSYSEESIGSRIELRPFVVIKEIPTIRVYVKKIPIAV